MHVAFKRIYNRIDYGGLVTSESRGVVAPSPDLLYSGLRYDVSERPLKIDAIIPQDTYWSMSLFNSRTDNYFSLNDVQAKSKKLSIVVVSKNNRNAVSDNKYDKIIEADSDKGIIIFRILIDNLDSKDRVSELQKIQRQTTCSLL
ncbi:MAG: DUF1254 domain-containing protein [Spirochaetes bacterium]|nr:MAG: DUF1254 domain-containing protein [Spirochaetota bacterium]